MKQPKQAARHWLERPETIAKLWRGGVVVLALTLAAELLYEGHPYFWIDGLFGFNAAFGFVGCLVMVLFAKLLGVFLKREEDYYDR